MRRSRFALVSSVSAACFALALLAPQTAVPADAPAAEKLAVKRSLNLEMAKQLAAVAEKEARKNNWKMVIALVDDAGRLIYLQRMDEAQYGSIEVAQQKAQTAVAFKRPTKAFEDAIKDGRTALLNLPILSLEGGLPLRVDDKVIGAIGVSGAMSSEDGVVAQAAVDALPGLLK